MIRAVGGVGKLASLASIVLSIAAIVCNVMISITTNITAEPPRGKVSKIQN
jgi:hypothetical protein